MRSAIAHRLIVVGLLAAAAIAAAAPGAQAQSGQGAIGASHSSLYGSTGRISLSVADIGRHEAAGEIYYRGGPDGAEGRLTARQSRARPDGALNLLFTAQIFDWDHLPYESTRVNLDALREWRGAGPLSFGVGVFADYADVTGVASRQSAILSRDLGSSTAAGVRFVTRHETGSFDDPFPTGPRRALEVATRLAALADRQHAAIELEAQFDVPVRERLALTATVSGGAVAGLDGSYVAVLDRAFQGDSRPRGFEYGGLGPRDPVTGDPLGGTRYYAGTLAASHQLASESAIVSGFIDFGSTWRVAGVSASGLDDGHALRASIGLSLNVEFEFGQFQIAIAEPIESQPFDRAQAVSLSLRARF